MQKKSKLGKRTIVAVCLVILVIPLLLFLGIRVWGNRGYYVTSVCIVTVSLLPFFLIFEERRPKARELMVIAVMASLAVAGRAAFFMVPQFKPMGAILIIAGLSLGAEAGFLTGALAAFVSNFFFGQGPWTPWQMFAFGMMGFLSGLLFYRRDGEEPKNRLIVCGFGGIATVGIYGLIVDTASLLMYSRAVTWQGLLAVYASGLPFNLLHGISTVVFLFVLYRPMEKKLRRVRLKYGLLR